MRERDYPKNTKQSCEQAEHLVVSPDCANMAADRPQRRAAARKSGKPTFAEWAASPLTKYEFDPYSITAQQQFGDARAQNSAGSRIGGTSTDAFNRIGQPKSPYGVV